MRRLGFRLSFLAAILAAAFGAACAPAMASVQSVIHGGTYYGSVIVERGERVDGDLTVLFGNATLEGDVNGDVTVIGGSAYVEPGAAVQGDVNSFGGDVVSPVSPWAPGGPTHSDTRLFWPIAWDVVAVLVFLLFPLRTRLSLERLERHPGLCAAAGLIGWIAAIPLGIVLLCTIVLIPLIPLELVAIVAATFIGQAAISLLIGRRLIELIAPATTPSPLAALVCGLGLTTAAELVPVIGALVWSLVALVGLGAVLLSIVREGTFSGTPVPRPPVSGPPMPIA